MSSEHRALALAALDALQVRSPTSYAWCGATSTPLAREVELAMSDDVAREFLLYQLQQELYESFYCRGAPIPGARQLMPTKPAGASAFVDALAASNRGRGTVQPGWQLRGQEDQHLVVERGGLWLWVAPQQTVAGEDPQTVGLLLPSEMRKASPGFYVALGEAALPEQNGERLVRVYWHLTSSAAPKLLELLTGSLNGAAIPFQLKVLDDPDRYTRCDAGVLYTPQAYFEAIAPHVRGAYQALAGELRDAVPAFTKRLAPGLGLAEDPGDGQSFGMHRVLLLARAALHAHELGREDPDERVEILGELFAKEGLSFERPYLGPGSVDRYELPLV